MDSVHKLICFVLFQYTLVYSRRQFPDHLVVSRHIPTPLLLVFLDNTSYHIMAQDNPLCFMKQIFSGRRRQLRMAGVILQQIFGHLLYMAQTL